jgi:hypothetical protein
MLGDKKSVEVKEFTLKNKKKPKNLSIHINNEGD